MQYLDLYVIFFKDIYHGGNSGVASRLMRNICFWIFDSN